MRAPSIHRTRQAAVVLASALLLVACGSALGVTGSGGSGTYQGQVSGPAATPMPTSVPAAVSTAPPLEAQVPLLSLPSKSAPPVAPVTMRTFALFPFGNAGARGTVTVRLRSSGFVVSVAAQNLAPGTAHSIHLHAGSCRAAVTGTHLLILGTIVANGAGSGSLATHVGLPYTIGRYVIVYASLSPATIIGCADLGTI